LKNPREQSRGRLCVPLQFVQLPPRYGVCSAGAARPAANDVDFNATASSNATAAGVAIAVQLDDVRFTNSG